MAVLRVFLSVLLCVIVCVSCSYNYYMGKGNEIYESGRYYKSASRYEKAYNKGKTPEQKSLAAIKTAQAFAGIDRKKDTYNWYRKADRAYKEQPETYLKIADAAVAISDLETATEFYNKYEELADDEKGKEGLYYIEQLTSDLNEEGRYTVRLRKEFNSRNSDFAPVYYPHDTTIVYFASTRNPNTKRKAVKTNPVTGIGYSHIYKANFTQEIKNIDKKGNVTVKNLKEPRWLAPVLIKDSIYTNRSEGAMCFGSDGNILYFTSSRMIDGINVGTRIYKATEEIKGEDEEEEKAWSKVILSGICGDSVSIGHPALTPDGGRMYFVTDKLPGGFGGKDIWYVESSGGTWGEPVNAGELINTAGDEMFPYVRETGELYFASNGHYGFGGLDIYCVQEEDGKQTLKHFSAPINSTADDFGVAFKFGTENGLFTSSRMGRGDNIYEFYFIPQHLQVKLMAENAITEKPIPFIEVTVTADDGEVSRMMTDSLGIATMELSPEREYIFVTENPDFLKGKEVISTYGEATDRNYEISVKMQPIEKPIVIPNIYFDVAKWDLRPDAMVNLSQLLAILQDNPNITIELSAHTDMIGNEQANMVLSENRARAVVDFLIGKGIFWDRLEAKGYGKTQPRQINEKDARTFPFLQVGNVLNEQFIAQLHGEQKQTAMQLNRRIEFKVLKTDYTPGPDSKFNPNQKAIVAEGNKTIFFGTTQLKDLNSVKGKFFTLQLGVFKTMPQMLKDFRVVFTEKLKDGLVRFCTGIYDTQAEADTAADNLKNKGIDVVIKEYSH